MKLIKHIVILFFLASCSNDDGSIDNSLIDYISNRVSENGAVISCARSEEITNDVLVFYYSELDTSSLRLYQTNTIIQKTLNHND